MALTHLLYLHGFRSSPASFKAQMLARHVAHLNDGGATLDRKSTRLNSSH